MVSPFQKALDDMHEQWAKGITRAFERDMIEDGRGRGVSSRDPWPNEDPWPPAWVTWDRPEPEVLEFRGEPWVFEEHPGPSRVQMTFKGVPIHICARAPRPLLRMSEQQTFCPFCGESL
jgi:hypothetical protein